MKFRPVKREDMVSFIAARRDEVEALKVSARSGSNLLIRLGSRLELWSASRLVKDLEAIIAAEEEEDRRERNPDDLPGPWA